MINIFLCINNKYLANMTTLVHSILSNDEESSFRFYIVNKDIEKDFFENFRNTINYKNQLEIIDTKVGNKIIDEIYNLKLLNNINLGSEENYYNFFRPKSIKNSNYRLF